MEVPYKKIEVRAIGPFIACRKPKAQKTLRGSASSSLCLSVHGGSVCLGSSATSLSAFFFNCYFLSLEIHSDCVSSKAFSFNSSMSKQARQVLPLVNHLSLVGIEWY